jgi:hypothetical protein
MIRKDKLHKPTLPLVAFKPIQRPSNCSWYL